MQAILRRNAERLGGGVAQMTHLHALKHHFKTQHQKQQTPNDVSDFLTFNSGGGRRHSGDVYRHGIYTLARQCVARVQV